MEKSFINLAIQSALVILSKITYKNTIYIMFDQSFKKFIIYKIVIIRYLFKKFIYLFDCCLWRFPKCWWKCVPDSSLLYIQKWGSSDSGKKVGVFEIIKQKPINHFYIQGNQMTLQSKTIFGTLLTIESCI